MARGNPVRPLRARSGNVQRDPGQRQFRLTLIWGQSLGLAPVYCLLAGFQGMLYALYPLTLAHATDRGGTPTDTADIGAGLLLGYGIGAAAEPAVAGGVALAMGPAGRR